MIALAHMLLDGHSGSRRLGVFFLLLCHQLGQELWILSGFRTQLSYIRYRDSKFLGNILRWVVLVDDLVDDIDLLRSGQFGPTLAFLPACHRRRLHIFLWHNLMWIMFHSCASILQLFDEFIG